MMRSFWRSAIAALPILIGLGLSSAPPAAGAQASIGGATIDGTKWAADRALAVPSAIGGKPILNVNLFAGICFRISASISAWRRRAYMSAPTMSRRG
jgi:hypothetical protein